MVGGVQKSSPSLKSVTHPTMMKLDETQLYLTQRRSKKHMNHVTQPLSSAEIGIFFTENQQILLYQEIQI